MSTNTYHANEGISVQAEFYKVKTPQVAGTVIAGRNHYLVRKGGERVRIQIGDYIIRGENGEVDAMPPALFNQLFTIDADEVQAIADEKAAAEKAAIEAVAEAQEIETAQAEVAQVDDSDEAATLDAANAAEAEAAELTAEPSTQDSPAHDNIFEPADDAPVEPEAPADPPPKKAKKKSRRKKT